MIDWTPNAILVQLGPLSLYWYGIAYAVGLASAYWVMVRQARRFGENTAIIGNGLIVVAVAALLGGRLYHVIDQWQLYKDDLFKIVLPPYSGLGIFGGFLTGAIAFLFLVRYHKVSAWRWARHRRAGHLPDAGRRPRWQLLQPGAVRTADLAAVGHRDRLRTPRRRIPVHDLRARDDAFPSRCSCTNRCPACSRRRSWSGCRAGRPRGFASATSSPSCSSGSAASASSSSSCASGTGAWPISRRRRSSAPRSCW